MELDELLAVEGVEEIKQQNEVKIDVGEREEIKPEIASRPPVFMQKMRETIQSVKEYSWSRGEMGGLDWGIEQFNEAFEGLNTGVHLIGGQSNVGKSGICMQIGLMVAQKNRVVTKEKPKKAFVIYFSLDDSNNELLPRLIAIDQRIPINAVRFPKKYQDHMEYMERLEKGYEMLDDIVENFAMKDVNEGSSIEYIEKTVEEYYNELMRVDENYQIVIMVDNFHDITVDEIKFGSDQSGKYDHIADQLSRIATRFDAPIICTAEFRKINGNKRPTLDDIRETTKIVYEAKAIILCYNEVGIRGQQSKVFYNREGSDEKQPIFEADVRKNKFSSFKSRIFFEFIPSMSYFREVPKAGAVIYNQQLGG